MAQQKIQSVQLSETGVVPGSYISSDLTVDVSGRITSISNGSGGSSNQTESVWVLWNTNGGNNGTFDGSVNTYWLGYNQIDENSNPSWEVVLEQFEVDPGDFADVLVAFECISSGIYEIIMECMVTSLSGSFPPNLSSYGCELEAELPASAPEIFRKYHLRYSHPPVDIPQQVGPTEGNPLNNNAGLDNAGSISTFTERFIVKSYTGGIIKPYMFAMNYNSSSANVAFKTIISFRKISDYS